ncbi:hypothetical protein [Alkalimarinus coralli]|uniref:hypothetical protein n=1 Tax=Alkalimarinus coralli TaxID=2935863 RepID=UPI00202B390B|nr:hypothetical protein [Alkalimarinus coralli]
MNTNTQITDSKLLNFKFTGTGESFDSSGQPLGNGSQTMSLEYTIDTKGLEVSTRSIGELLGEFNFSTNAKSISLSIGNKNFDQNNSSADFNGLAVNDELNFWENSFSISLINATFNASQWIRHGTVESSKFVTSEGIEGYFSTATSNGTWYFNAPDGTTVRGVFSNVSVTAIQDSPAPSAPGSINVDAN